MKNGNEIYFILILFPKQISTFNVFLMLLSAKKILKCLIFSGKNYTFLYFFVLNT